VAIRTGATVANARRTDYADLARRRTGLTASGISAGAGSAADFLEARFFGSGGVSSTAIGVTDAGGADFLARAFVATGRAG